MTFFTRMAVVCPRDIEADGPLPMSPAVPRRRHVNRIAVLNSHPIQYFAPLYAYLNGAEDFDITALYLSDVSLRGGHDDDFSREIKWDVDLLTGYKAIFLGERSRRRKLGGFWSLIAPEVWRELHSGRYDILWLHGHNYAANLLAFVAAKSAGLKIFMRCETHLGLPCPRGKEMLRRLLLGTLYRRCDALLAIGSANAAFYRAMGIHDHKIFRVPYSVDNARFSACARISRPERHAIRAKYGIPANLPAILFAAKFIERKRPADLLRAALHLRRAGAPPFSLVMVGTGALEHDLRAFCAYHSLANVIFPGFVNQSELPKLYGACDIFVLPSESEPWGLAVNEAMCAGLPIIASREIGCAPDLIENEVTGFTPCAGDIDGLTTALATLIKDPSLRQRMGRASLARISRWSFRECLLGFRAACSALPSER